MTGKTLKREIEDALAHADRVLYRLKSQSVARSKRSTVVICESDRLAAGRLRELFAADFNIRIYPKAEELLDAIQTLTPDAAILDMRLLDGNGFEVLRQLRNIKPELPVLSHTGRLGDYLETRVTLTGVTENGFAESEINIEELEGFTRPASEIYNELKNNVVQSLTEDFSNRRHCRYSKVFEQCEGRVLASHEAMTMSFKEIVREERLMPFCRISNDLSKIREEENTRICPFHMDVDPKETPKRYNVGDFSSYRCGYYEYAILGKIEERLLKALEKRKNEDSYIHKIVDTSDGHSKATVNCRKPTSKVQSRPKVMISQSSC